VYIHLRVNIYVHVCMYRCDMWLIHNDVQEYMLSGHIQNVSHSWEYCITECKSFMRILHYIMLTFWIWPDNDLHLMQYSHEWLTFWIWPDSVCKSIMRILHYIYVHVYINMYTCIYICLCMYVLKWHHSFIMMCRSTCCRTVFRMWVIQK